MAPIKPVSDIDRYVIAQVKARRLELKMSQAQLSYHLDTSSTYIAQVESPHYPTRYSLDRIHQLARILHCRMSDFFPDPYL